MGGEGGRAMVPPPLPDLLLGGGHRGHTLCRLSIY